MSVSVSDQKVVITNGASSAEIYLFGATVTSWKVAGHEKLFLSNKAVLDGSKAVRGGIPLVFPHFGPNPKYGLPQHGFARLSKWSWVGTQTVNENETSVAFSLDPSGVAPALAGKWPHQFKLVFTVVLTANTLKTSLSAENTGDSEFEFTSLLHSYFAINDIDNAKIRGLQGKLYDEKIHNKVKVTEESDLVGFSAEVDRVYYNVGKAGVSIVENGATVTSITTNGFDDVVVWNPWIEKSQGMNDFQEAGYKVMVCVEVGQIGTPVVLKPGEKWVGEQLLR
ncbi:galactose mutarotase-like domain-containing protein [Obelidium mucronatum]|nr:galactose mutarotase-like domain-containing protein [Obelidium mucronatum]